MLIYLDFDGVITHKSLELQRHLSPEENRGGAWGMPGIPLRSYWIDLCPSCIQQLNTLVDLTNGQVVISSDWRRQHNKNNLIKHLKAFGFLGKVIDVTPIKIQMYTRTTEIITHMYNINYEGDYIVLDDEANHLRNIPHDNFVYIKHGWKRGGLCSNRAKWELTRVLRKRGIIWPHQQEKLVMP